MYAPPNSLAPLALSFLQALELQYWKTLNYCSGTKIVLERAIPSQESFNLLFDAKIAVQPPP
jgi:iron-sulfur cluster repair protein YtfE (RIC family)